MTKEFFERGKQIAEWADNNMKQHKWHKEIKAWADGAEIEFSFDNETWKLCNKEFEPPKWYENVYYRIKPQPVEPQYLYVFQSLSGNFSCRKERHAFEYIGEYLGKIPLIVENNDD